MKARIAPIGWSIALHVVLAGLLYLGITLPRQEPQETMRPIDAVVVDDAVLEAAGRKRGDQEQVALEERRREEARLEAERLELEKAAQEEERRRQQEQERLEAEQTARAEAEARQRAEAESRQRAEAEAKRKVEEEAKAKAAAAEKQRAARESKLRVEREAELRARLAEEETKSSPGYQSLKASYVAAIQAHVERHWYEPPGMTQGLVCRIFVMQIPGGEVTGTRFGACNGNAVVRQSIETAVRNSSPLPAPPEPSLFEREVELVFTPKE